MKADIIIIGGGASGLMAAYYAARGAVQAGSAVQVTVLEKMPRPGRKIMITGKGRCNFTNVKDWNEFSPHIRSKANFLRSAFYTLPPQKTVEFFESLGMKTVIERGDRAFPLSYHASDVVDTLVRACHSVGVKIESDFEVEAIGRVSQGVGFADPTTSHRSWSPLFRAEGGTSLRDPADSPESIFEITSTDGRKYSCSRLIIATGGLSYPTTGSSGDGLKWAEESGHRLTPLFPSLTALVPKGYKNTDGKDLHIDRSTPLAELGRKFCGRQLKYVTATLLIDGNPTDTESGELFFTDGGIEGPVGFQLSRKAVKALTNGSKVKLNVLVNPLSPEKDQEKWSFDIAGFVGYERAVITAGGVSTEDVIAKTMESRLVPGLYFCGEVLDADADTGGYNLQIAFCTGALAGTNAQKSL